MSKVNPNNHKLSVSRATQPQLTLLFSWDASNRIRVFTILIAIHNSNHMDSNRTAIELFRLWSQQSQSQESSNQNDYSNIGNNSNQSNTTPQYPSAQQSLTPLPIAYANTFPANNSTPDPPNNNTMTAAASAQRNTPTMAPATLSYGAPHPGALLFNANRRAQLQLQQHQMRTRPAGAIHRVLGERELFLIFIKILFKCIERCSNGRLRQRAKAIVTECTRRNRMGDSKFSPLQDAVETRLKDIVGDMYWNQAKVYTGYYCQQKGIRTAVGV
jgi:hypothetical protein